MDCIVHGVTKSQTLLSDFHFSLSKDTQVVLVVKNLTANARGVRDAGSIPGLGGSLEEGMATHSSVLAWRIPWTEEPGGVHGVPESRIQLT